MVPSESCDINWYQRFKLQEPNTCQHFWNGLYYDSRQEKAKEFLKKFKEYLSKAKLERNYYNKNEHQIDSNSIGMLRWCLDFYPLKVLFIFIFIFVSCLSDSCIASELL